MRPRKAALSFKLRRDFARAGRIGTLYDPSLTAVYFPPPSVARRATRQTGWDDYHHPLWGFARRVGILGTVIYVTNFLVQRDVAHLPQVCNHALHFCIEYANTVHTMLAREIRFVPCQGTCQQAW